MRHHRRLQRSEVDGPARIAARQVYNSVRVCFFEDWVWVCIDLYTHTYVYVGVAVGVWGVCGWVGGGGGGLDLNRT